MKKILSLIFLFVICCINCNAQQYLKVHKSSGLIIEVNVDEIDSVTFESKEVEELPDDVGGSEYITGSSATVFNDMSVQFCISVNVPAGTTMYAVGVLFSKSSNPTLTNGKMISQNISSSTQNNYFVNANDLDFNTKYYYRPFLYSVLTSSYYYGYVKSFTTFGEITNGDIIDLGLSSGVCWASMNIGATSVYEYGDLFAWGETTTKSSFSKYNYKYYFNGDYFDLGSDISKTEFDVARQVWGKEWRMPSKKEFYELINECKWTYKKEGNTPGYVVTGPNGNSIFLPSSSASTSIPNENGNPGIYWTSNAYSIILSNDISYESYGREYGFNIRPVYSRLRGKNMPYRNSSLSTFSTYSTKEYDAWVKGTSYTQATGYQAWGNSAMKTNEEVESYLISPALNTTCESGKVRLSFDYTLRYTNDVPNWQKCHKLLISKDYNGNPEDFTEATWIELNFTPKASAYSDWTLYSSNYIKIPEEYVNCKSVYIAYYYYAPSTVSTTWELRNFIIDEGEASESGDDSDTPSESAGTKDSPLSVANAKNKVGNTGYVTGYIVGYIDGTKLETGARFEAASETESEVLIADAANCKDATLCFPVQLPLGTIRTALNPAIASNIGKKVTVYGSIETFFGTTGMKSTSWAKIDGKEIDIDSDVPDTPSTISGSISISGTTVTLTNSAVTAGSDTVSLTVNDLGITDKASAVGTYSFSDGTTLTVAQGDGKSGPTYYTASNGFRLYASNTLSFAAASPIARIEFECDSYNGTDYVGNSTATVSFSGNSAVYCNKNEANSGGTQLRVKTIKIIYGK